MAKKKHSSSSNQPSSLNPQQEKTQTAPPPGTHAPPPSKPSSSSESQSNPHPNQIQPLPPSNSKKQTAASDAAAAADSLNPPRQRLFTENDEILILKGLSDFKSKTGNSTMTHYSAFYNSFKDSLSVKPTQKQLRQRIWKLKHKFEKKKGENENFPTFSSSHEKQVFELSMKFWGQENEDGEKEKPPKKEIAAMKLMPEEFVKGGSSDKMGYFCLKEMLCFDKMGMGVNVLKRGMELIGESERVELERRWKKLKLQERKLFEERFELVEDSFDSIFQALQESS